MKKIFLFAVVAAAIGAGTCLGFQSATTVEEFDSIQLANLHALTEDEGDDYVVRCFCKTNWFSSNICSANAEGAYCGGDPCVSHDTNCR